MSESTPVRPPQVTMAAWVTMIGSLFLLFSVFEIVANLRSLDTRERVLESLSEPPLSGTGFDVEQVLSLLHSVAIVAAACATAAAILGWQVMRRNRMARLVLSIVVVPLFLAGIVTGGFLSSMVAVSALLLWTRPARDWFDGIAPTAPTPSPAERPPPAATPPPYVGEYGAAPRPAFTNARPREVVQACILVWVFSGVVLIAMVIALAAFGIDPALVEQVYESDPRFATGDVTPEALRALSLVLAGTFLVWSAVAVGLAVLTFRRSNGARIALIISSAVAGMLSVVMAFAAPALMLLTVACVLAVVLLTRPAGNAWFADRP